MADVPSSTGVMVPAAIRERFAPRSAARVAAVPFLRQTALYPTYYTWYILLSALDLLLTWVILHAGGQEENFIAAWVIERYNLLGVVAYKFSLVTFVLLVCQFAGSRSDEAGRLLARWSIALSLFPVLIGAGHLLHVALILHVP